MSPDIIFVFVLLGLALFLFSTNYVSFDVASIILLVCLLASGILTPEEGFSGVSNPATISIAAMFVISEGIRRTGILNKTGDFFCNKMKRNFWFWLFAMLLFVSFASAFMNNTAVIMIFIPVVIDIASRIDISPSKLLMPLSFAAIMGGINTLIGTSTNLLVNSIVESRGAHALTMFDFAPMGLIFLAGGFVYMYLFGFDFIPPRREKEDLTSGFKMQQYLTDLRVESNSKLVEKFLDEEELTRELDLDVLRIFKPESDSSAQRTKTKVEAGDLLRIRGSASEIDKLLRREDLSLVPSSKWADVDLKHGRDTLVEAAVAPESTLEGRALGEINFYERFGAIPLAIRHRGELQQEDLSKVTISGGDTMLLSLSSDRLRDINNDSNFVI
ncbi:MAG TPA: SLC13 family permease [Balneolaceae bacterium]|nr:SLC13 family permease [Balneolaceae bacterium]